MSYNLLVKPTKAAATTVFGLDYKYFLLNLKIIVENFSFCYEIKRYYF